MRVCLMLVMAGCSAPATTADYLAAGSYGIGFHTFTFVDDSRPTPANGVYPGAPNRTLVVDVWYPSTGQPSDGSVLDAQIAAGVFPLILHSHGFMDNRDGENYLGEHLATRGYIVAAPDYPLSNGGAPGGATLLDTPSQPGDASFVIDQVLAQTSPALGAAVDTSHIAASGLSLGGLTTLLLAFHPRLRDPRVVAALPLAALSCFLTAPFYQTADVPIFFVQGDSDVIVSTPENSVRAFGLAEEPRELALLARGTHTGFVNVATLFDPTMDFDRLGCAALSGKVDLSQITLLGTTDEGIGTDPSLCPLPCSGNIPFVDPPLAAQRQQDLATVAATAFFDARLKNDPRAAAFLDTNGRFASDNVEVTLTAH